MRRRIGAFLAPTLFLLSFVSGAAQQPPTTLRPDDPASFFPPGPHVGPVERALVGIEVTSSSDDGAVTQVRRGCGFVLRCDGFVVAPTSLFSQTITVAGQSETAGRQTISIVFEPGTEKERRMRGRRPRHIERGLDYAVLKVDDVHVPALRTLLPDAVTPGTAVTVAWTAWDAAARRFLPLVRHTSKAGEPVADDAHPGVVALSEPLEGVPPGAVVLGPEGLAVGLMVAGGAAGKSAAFLSFSMLHRATNCVTPLARPPGASTADLPPGDTPTVAVPGGALLLPVVVAVEQPDLEGAPAACVAPFEIDKYEVTNAQYLAFWQTLPESDRRRLGFRANYYPAGWSVTESPFAGGMENMPVLGVPLPGARAYATWRGKRLPTPYEWSLAAFGPQGEHALPDWAIRYITDRQNAWQKIREAHIEHLRMHAELQQMAVFLPTLYYLPWIARTPLFQNASAWSRQTIERTLAPIWGMYRDPLYVRAVGERSFDVSPYGAADMILNASELVAPTPGPPALGAPRWMEMTWTPLTPPRDDPWTVRGPEAITGPAGLPPLSRLFRRARIGPPIEEVMIASSLDEAARMLGPLAGWQLRMGREAVSTAVMWPAGRSPYEVFGRPAGLDVWQGMPAHFRPEMGRPVPFDRTDTHVSSGPQLFYQAPVGFRCAR